MRRFNRYQSRAMQFSLDLFSRLQNGPLSGEMLAALARQWGLDYADQVVQPLREAELLQWDGELCRLVPGQPVPRLPMSTPERRYLRAMLDLPEAELFLSPETEEKLREQCAGTEPETPVEHWDPAGEPVPRQPGPEGFQTLLRAAERRWLVDYIYRTNTDETLRQARALPWKLEYSAYDRRWWVIFYRSEEQRTIKARLENLRQIRLVGPSDVTEAEVEEAMDRLMEPEPVVLEVTRTRGGVGALLPGI